ncbi:ATP citrate lyase subunit 1 [Neonectria magnoliae]|uniref:Large ribosomal subunit protein uL30m n=1 Tax=Neonectria magnoliae TaxID=2732573 RepID=A0ABR1HWS6_9HYPO
MDDRMWVPVDFVPLLGWRFFDGRPDYDDDDDEDDGGCVFATSLFYDTTPKPEPRSQRHTSGTSPQPPLEETKKKAMSYFRITLHRSAIGLPERTRGVLAALGLRRRMQTVFHPVHPQFAGMILKVKELVRVQEVERALSKQEVKAERTPDTGFYVEKAVPRL